MLRRASILAIRSAASLRAAADAGVLSTTTSTTSSKAITLSRARSWTWRARTSASLESSISRHSTSQPSARACSMRTRSSSVTRASCRPGSRSASAITPPGCRAHPVGTLSRRSAARLAACDNGLAWSASADTDRRAIWVSTGTNGSRSFVSPDTLSAIVSLPGASSVRAEHRVGRSRDWHLDADGTRCRRHQLAAPGSTLNRHSATRLGPRSATIEARNLRQVGARRHPGAAPQPFWPALLSGS